MWWRSVSKTEGKIDLAEIDYLLAVERFLDESRGLPIGTVRRWSDGNDYVKIGKDKWVSKEEYRASRGSHVGLKTKSHSMHSSPLSRSLKKGNKNVIAHFRSKSRGSGGGSEAEAREELKHSDFEKLPPRGNWVDKAPGLPESTMAVHFEGNGQPRPHRAELHDRIIRSMLSHVPSQEEGARKHAILTMGTPGAGKSTARSRFMQAEYVIADPDRIKEELPEYNEARAKRAKNAAHIVHEESGYINDKLLEHAIRANKNLVLDGVGSNPNFYNEFAKRLKDNGYHVSLVMVHVDSPDIAIKRANDRGERLGRFVPESYVKEMHGSLPKNFLKVVPQADDFAVMDSSRPGEPRMVWEKGPRGEQVHDRGYVERHWPKDVAESIYLALADIFAISEASKLEKGSHKVFAALMEARRDYDLLLSKFPRVYKEGIVWPSDDDITGRFFKHPLK